MDTNAQLGKAQSLIVIAIELRARHGGPASPAGHQDFAALLGASLAHACTLQSAERLDGTWASTALFPDTGQTLALLRRMENIQSEFHETHPGDLARFLIHYGVAFTTRPGHARGYIGSAIRSAHSHLERLPTDLDKAATTEFMTLTLGWAGATIHFDELPLAQRHLGLHPFSLDRGDQEDQPAHSDRESALHAFLVSKLATHMGPFAQVLVESARRSAKTMEDFIEEAAREIDDIPVRAAFREEARAFLRSLGG